MTTTKHDTIGEWATLVTTTANLSEILGVSPCEGLEQAFPAIVGDDETMSALASMLGPVIETVAPLVVSGVVSADDGETFVHNIFHLFQIAAGLGHMIGVSDAIGETAVPGDLSGVDWGSLPDTFGEDDNGEQS